MKLLYASSVKYPSTLANRIQILEMARAFFYLLGDQFTLALPASSKLSEPFSIELISGSQKSFVLAWRIVHLMKEGAYTHLFCREERLLFFMLIFMRLFRVRAHVAFEAHFVPEHYDPFFWFVVRRADRVIVLTSHTKKMLAERGVEHVLVAPDGINLEAFQNFGSKEENRRRFSLALEAPLVVYNGQLRPWKGEDTLLQAARLLPHVQFVFLGGDEAYVREKERACAGMPNIRFLPHQKHGDIPRWLAASDLFVLANSAKYAIGRLHTSPLKLFEYMAVGRPIVASDLPSIREVLSEETAWLVEPDDPEALKEGIEKALANTEESDKKAEKAEEVVRAYTWKKRAKSIIEYLT